MSNHRKAKIIYDAFVKGEINKETSKIMQALDLAENYRDYLPTPVIKLTPTLITYVTNRINRVVIGNNEYSRQLSSWRKDAFKTMFVNMSNHELVLWSKEAIEKDLTHKELLKRLDFLNDRYTSLNIDYEMIKNVTSVLDMDAEDGTFIKRTQNGIR